MTKKSVHFVNPSSHGFTLIELMITITIIAILTAAGIFTYTSAQGRARDAKRKSEMEQYKNALEVYANKNNGFYPSQTAATGAQLSTTVCTNLGLTKCAEDSLFGNNAAYHYNYQSDGTGGGSVTGTQYVIWGPLENAAGDYWVFCSNGKSGKVTGAPSTTLGACPNGL